MQHKDLIEKAQKGDMFAFRALVNEYKEQAVRIAYSVTGNLADAQDAAQDVFLRVYKNISTYKFNAEFSTWLYRITVNVCYDFLRKRKSGRLLLEGNTGELKEAESQLKESSNPAKDLLDKELKRKIEDALRLLPEKQQIVFSLRYKSDMKIREIAGILGISASAVKSHLFRAVSAMQKNLSPYMR